MNGGLEFGTKRLSKSHQTYSQYVISEVLVIDDYFFHGRFKAEFL